MAAVLLGLQGRLTSLQICGEAAQRRPEDDALSKLPHSETHHGQKVVGKRQQLRLGFGQTGCRLKAEE